MLPYFGKILIFVGLFLILIGILFLFSPKIPLNAKHYKEGDSPTGLYFGKLPGDIYIRRGNFTFYAPIVSLFILSIILSIIFNIILKIFIK